MSGGLRIDNYRPEQVNAYPSTTASGGLSLPKITSWTRTTFKDDETLVNYQAGAVYKPRPNGSVYVSVGTSSTPPGNSLGQGLESQSLTGTVNGVANTALNLEPERNKSIEIGTKWDLLDNNLALTGSIFRIDTENARITDPVTGEVTQAGDKQVQGAQIGATGNLTRQLQIFGGYTYMASEGKNLGVSAVNISTTSRAQTVYVPNAATGQPFPNTPRNSATVRLSYKRTASWTFGLGAYYQSQVYGGYAWAANTGGLTLIKRGVPGYTRFDAMAGYQFNKNFSLQFNVQNLGDKTYYSTAYSTHYANLAPGRSYTLMGTISF